MGWYKLCLLSTGLACVGAALAQADPAVAGSTSVSPTHVSGRRVSVVAAGEARINAPFRSPRVDLISQLHAENAPRERSAAGRRARDRARDSHWTPELANLLPGRPERARLNWGCSSPELGG